MNVNQALFLLIVFATVCSDARQKYGYTVDIFVSPSQKRIIQKERADGGLDMYHVSNTNGNLTITAGVTNATMDVLKEANIPFQVLSHTPTDVYWRTMLNVEPPGIVQNRITFDRDLRYEEIMQYLDGIAQRSTSRRKISVETIGRSFQGRELRLVKIEHPHARNIMFFDAGIHAREWLSINTALYLITRLIDESHTNPINGMNWYIVPLVNPDGYVESYTTERYHRKNMNFTSCPVYCESCGIDLNRNYDVQWGTNSQTGYFCGETYPGVHAFSEKETLALSRTLKKYHKKVKLYVALHTYGCEMLYPWGYAEVPCPDADDLIAAARKAADAMNRLRNNDRPCHWGVTHAGQMPGGGGGDDYAKEILGIKYSYTMELQGGSEEYGFVYNTSQIRPFVSQSYVGIITLANYINHRYHSRRHYARVA